MRTEAELTALKAQSDEAHAMFQEPKNHTDYLGQVWLELAREVDKENQKRAILAEMKEKGEI